MIEEQLFHQALEQPADQRASFLDAACKGDADLRERVQVLLRAYANPGSFLELPPRGAAPTIDHPALEQSGTLIGPYELVEQIGEGGMGVVYLASQREPIDRQVALKIIKPGMDSREVVARFEAERQALAMMDHPNIAKVFDAGVTDAGRPFFVMELIKRGKPITEYCDREQLTNHERLALFVGVCQGVQHAHQKGIIHRDLKPSNVLIKVYDVRPVPMVIDFGIAKAVGQQRPDKSLRTGLSQLVGTPLYMSPEQAGESSTDVDTRSDVYSLGVLLYELLTGYTPFEKDTLGRVGVDEMRRIIREVDPPRPSTRVSTLQAANLSTISERRHMESHKLSQQLRGDLDWIVMKALEKDRNRRYATANDLAEDIERYLRDEPVLAVPPSAAYRMKKFSRRNKRTLLIASAAALVMLLGVATIGSSVGYIVRDQQVRLAEAVRAVENALDVATSLEQQGKWSAALEAAMRAQVAADLQDGNEELRARVQQRIKDLTMVLRLEEIRLETSVVKDDEFDWRLADPLYAQAFRDYGIDVETLTPEEVAQRMPDGAIRSELAAALDDWARLSRADGVDIKDKKVIPYKGNRQRLVAAAQATDPDPQRSRLRVAWLKNDKKAAQELLASVPLESLHPSQVTLLKYLLAPDRYLTLLRDAQFRHPSDFWLNHSLAYALHTTESSNASEALRFFQAALALRPDSPGALLNLASALSQLGRRDEAIAILERAIQIKPDYAAAYNNLGNEFRRQGAADKAISAYRKAIALNPQSAGVHYNLGTTLILPGGWNKEAETAFREAIRLNPRDTEAYCNLGALLGRKGDLVGAEAAHRKAIEIDPNHAQAYNGLGAFLCDSRKDYDGAIAAFRRAIQLRLTDGRAHQNLGNALLRKGELDEAVAAYRQAVDLDPEKAAFRYCLGNALLRKGELKEAIAACRQAVVLDPKDGKGHFHLGETLRRTGQLKEAIEEFRLAIRLKPNLAAAHGSLSSALADNGDLDAAIGQYQQAIQLEPNDFATHLNLCIVLMQKESWDEAIAAAREAIRCKPDLPEAHCNLGRALQEKGQPREALEALQRGHELGTKDPNWKFPSARWVRECEELLKKSEVKQAPPDVPPTVEPAPAPAGNEEEKTK